jgi:hypothetical protein
MEKEYYNSKTAQPVCVNAKHVTTCQDSMDLPIPLAHRMNESGEKGIHKIFTKCNNQIKVILPIPDMTIPIVQPTRCTCYLKLFILVKRSTCFGRPLRPSSGAQNCVYSNGICPTVAATCCVPSHPRQQQVAAAG